MTKSLSWKISILMKIRPEGAELFHADRQTDGRTDRQTDRRIYGVMYRKADKVTG